MSPHSIRRTNLSAGFSLVEIMVGMLIGLLGLMVMTQVGSVFEAQKRTTTGGDDAQNNGAIALYGMQRDIQQGGYGISSYQLIGCKVSFPGGGPLTALAPVTINPPTTVIPAGDPNTDTLLVIYGNTSGSTQGDTITSINTPNYVVQTPSSFTLNDYVVAESQTRPSPCNLTLTKITSAPGINPIQVATGVVVASGDTIYNLGQSPKVLAYAIRGGNLTVCDYMVNNCSQSTASNWLSIASNIVSMRAQYGRDAVVPVPVGQTSYVVVNTFNQSTPTTPATLSCDWTRIIAVRIALVARNEKSEGSSVTAAAPVWAGSVASADPSVAAINLTKNPDNSSNANWNNYRYKVFQTLIPLRNVAWQGTQTGC